MFSFFAKAKAPTQFRLEEVTDKNGIHWEIWEKKPGKAWKYCFTGEAKTQRNKDTMLSILKMLREEEAKKDVPITRKVIA